MHSDSSGRFPVSVTRVGGLRRVGTIQPRAHRKGVAHRSAPPPEVSASEEKRRDQLILELLPLVKRIARMTRRRLPAHIELDDLVGAGCLGLLDALRKFDPTKRVKIETYARHRIRGAMLDSLRSLDNASRDMRKKSRRLEKVYRDVEARIGRPVGNEELADELGISIEDCHRTLLELQTVGFTGARPAAGAASSTRPEELLAADNGQDPFERCCRLEQRKIVQRALAALPERERLVVALYYEYEQPRTMQEIAVKLGVDQSRVSQLHSAALTRLRRRVKTLLDEPSAALAGRAGGGPREAIDGNFAAGARASN